jgi:iron complex outermembrane recepter protein
MSTKNTTIAFQLSAIIAAGTAGFAPNIALGQSVLEEVVVTARKREESLQETPVAISAFNNQTLEELGLNNITDLTRVVPNVDMYAGNGTTGAGNVFIRGVGARNTGVNFDSGVGIYVDGVYVPRADGAILDNVDIQSIQVLRGPQGTLFGKNTTGGAILYATNKPNEEFGGHVEGRVGNYNQMDGKGTLNIPIIGDTLMSRFSVFSTNRDGYVKSKIPDGLPAQATGNYPGFTDGEDYNDVERYGGQAQLRWVASDTLLLDLNYNYAKTDQKSRGQNCEVVEGIEGAGWQAALQDPFIIEPSTGQTIKDWCRDNERLGKDKIMTNLTPNKYQAEVNTLALTVDWEVGDYGTFKSISSARNTEGGEVNELDAISIALLGRTNYKWNSTEKRNTDSYSQEFQFAGTAFEDKLDYVVGTFGFHEETDKGTAASPSGPFFGSLGDPNLAFYQNATTELLTKNSSLSFYSQADWNFNEYWRLTLGARYTWEEKKLTRRFRPVDVSTLAKTGDASVSAINETFFEFPSGPDSFNPDHGFAYATGPNGQPDPLGNQTQKYDDSKITPMASIQRNFDAIGFMDSGTLYFTIANGYLSGGITDTTNVATNLIENYDPEEVWNYEIGFKMEAWDNKLRLNSALFYNDYEDRQLTTVRINPETGRIAGALINAESSWIAGVEFEAIVLPVENLQITANVTFNDSDIDKYEDERIFAAVDGAPVPDGCTNIPVGLSTVNSCPVDRSDEDLPRLPDSIYFLAVQYTFATEYGDVVPMVSWSYRTNLDNCFDVSSCQSGIYKVNQEDVTARLTWTSPEMNWRVTAYGNNLTDDRYVEGGTPLVDVTETAGTIYNTPRTYGIEAAYTW